jgi:hypothetical protein
MGACLDFCLGHMNKLRERFCEWSRPLCTGTIVH